MTIFNDGSNSAYVHSLHMQWSNHSIVNSYASWLISKRFEVALIALCHQRKSTRGKHIGSARPNSAVSMRQHGTNVHSATNTRKVLLQVLKSTDFLDRQTSIIAL
jgi:hypothetical protein